MSTVNYSYPVSGAAPSSHAVFTCSYVTGQLVMGDTDTTATISHNFNNQQVRGGQNQTDALSRWPKFSYMFTTAPTTTLAGAALAYAQGTNAITVTKIAQTGSGFTADFWVEMPATITR